MSLEDNLIFKEEVLKTVHEFKETLMKNMDSKLSKLTLKNEQLKKVIDHLTESNKKILENITSKQVSLEKINQLENFKNKVDSMLITHEIRINNNIEELGSIRTRYDKALIDNLLVPGYIGPSCQFKNIGEFIVHNISEISKVKSEREVMKNNFKEIRTKTDSVMRTILNLTESLVKRCNDYTNSQISEMKSLIFEKVNEMNIKERKIQESIINFEKEQKNMKLTDKLEEVKNDILSMFDSKFAEKRKSIDEYFYNEINKNNSFLENYTKNLIDDKLKEINNNLTEIQNKLKNNKLLIQNNNLPLVPSTQKNLIKNENIRSNSIQNSRKGKTNEFIDINNNNNNNYIPNKTFSNINNMKKMNLLNNNIIKKNKENKNYEVQKNNNDKSLEGILIEEIEKDNKKQKEQKEIPDIVLKHRESKLLLLNYNKDQKLRKYSNNLYEIKSGKNLGKKFSAINIINSPKNKDNAANNNNESANTTFNQKNNKIENEIQEPTNNIQNIEINNNIDSNINLDSNNNIDIDSNNIINIEQDYKTPMSVKKFVITEENIKNIHKLIQDKKNINNIKINVKDKIIQENKNIIDELKIPQILERRILSNDELEEIKLNTEKARSLNKKKNFKKDLNKSVSASYKSINRKNTYLSPNHNQILNKTLKNWRKNIINKNEKNLKLGKERNINNNKIYNMVNLELAQDNYTMNGATVLANKKLENIHVTKMEGQSSFNKLFNASVSKNIFQNNENL